MRYIVHLIICFISTGFFLTPCFADPAISQSQLTDLPKWDYRTIRAMFEVYRHPEAHQLPLQQDEHLYNLQFINAHWGPMGNPFVQFARPAKIFVSWGENYLIAPVVQDVSDGNIYVFDRDQHEPMLLSSWMALIQQKYNMDTLPRVSICNGYGSLPSDVCDQTSYQHELAITYQVKTSYHLSQSAVASQSVLEKNSAHRELNEDWEKINHHRISLTANSEKTILSTSIDWNNIFARKKLLLTVSAWKDSHTIQDNFAKMRDLRYFQDDNLSNFIRRITWLYPDDGCWTRASAVIKDLFGPFGNTVNPFARPSKIFAFGNLCAETPNSPTGVVAWWYHTAPVIRDASTDQIYVLDPSINPDKPLTVEEWMKSITNKSGNCKPTKNTLSKQLRFNICDGYNARPYSPACNTSEKVSFAEEANAVLLQKKFRESERERQISLGRDPEAVLGDLPPWAN